jgi:hypothetical protein
VALTPTESTIAEYHSYKAQLATWERAIDCALGKGEQTFYYTNPDMDVYLPVLAAKYDAYGWTLYLGAAGDGCTKTITFTLNPTHL